MSQNLTAFVAAKATGGATLLKTDAVGNLLTASSGASAATPVSGHSGNVAAAVAAASLAQTASVTNYISGFSFTAAGATAASVVQATLAGVAGGTMTFVIAVPAGANVAVTPLCVTFNPPLAASAANTAITFSVPSLGSGNTNAAANIWGYQI